MSSFLFTFVSPYRYIVILQLSLFNYIIDAYLSAAASAIAANIICRSVAGAVFPVCFWNTVCHWVM